MLLPRILKVIPHFVVNPTPNCHIFVPADITALWLHSKPSPNNMRIFS